MWRVKPADTTAEGPAAPASEKLGLDRGILPGIADLAARQQLEKGLTRRQRISQLLAPDQRHIQGH